MSSLSVSIVRAAGMALGLLVAYAELAHAKTPLLLRFPTVSRTQIVFSYASDLWSVAREGGDARRLTVDIGEETAPHFSPDGSLIAFTAEYDEGTDVFVVAASGGVPRRLTYHPAAETALGWTPDGSSVLFSSAANSFTARAKQLYAVSLDGGLPLKLPLPTGEDAAYSPAADRVAYVPNRQSQPQWIGYRGGQTTPIWIARLSDSEVSRVPRDNSNDSSPMWVGETIYFLSDRNGPTSLFSYDPQSNSVVELLRGDGFGIKTASAGPDAIVIEQLGEIKLYDLRTGTAKHIDVRVQGDLPMVRKRAVKVEPKHIRGFSFAPTGARVAFEAWGEIFTASPGRGDIANATRSPGVAERSPAWSPDGKSLAYFSDASGEYELHIRDAGGSSAARRITLDDHPSFYYDPVWSPDGRKIAYSDKRQNLWYVDLATGASVLVAADRFGKLERGLFDPAWSPDSAWIGYTRRLPNRLHAVFIYSLQARKAFAVTDAMADARHPRFDVNGRYLYFIASTDVALAAAGGEMSSFDRRVTSSVYAVVLSKREPLPLAPARQTSDEAGKGRPQGTAGVAEVSVDVDGIQQRTVALPLPARNYTDLQSGRSGILFLSEGPVVIAHSREQTAQSLQRFNLATRSLEKIADGISGFSISACGERLLYRRADDWLTADANAPAGSAAHSMNLDNWTVWIVPTAMWRQIYDEAWRIERDFFYDPGYHGLDLVRAKAEYAPFLAGIASRAELTHLLREALAELGVGHLYVRDGHREPPAVSPPATGLLGADYSIENGRYRIARIYGGESWNPELRAPLMQPGIDVVEGDYILAVNARQLGGRDNIYSFFEGLSGKEVVLSIARHADGTAAREVNVVPIESEAGLRTRAWIEDNRRRVDRQTQGRVGYVYLPNTANEGYASFNRYFFAQVDKDALIIDERFNSGGQLPGYIIDCLRRPVMSRAMTREGVEWSNPEQAVFGPKVMIINERAGSGGDALPWYFRKAGLGPLVGKTTWGGFVGVGESPELIDGGSVTAPGIAFYGLDGEWEVENHGVVPDHEVELEPAAFRRGRDAQLEKAIELAKQQLAAQPALQFRRPAYPSYHKGSASAPVRDR